jgi:HK97 family phage portal protein
VGADAVSLRERVGRWLLRDTERRQIGDPMPPLAGNYVVPYYGTVTYAENLSAVLACVSAISAAIATLPALVYRQDGDRRIEDKRHWLNALIARPNTLQTWCDFIEWLVAQMLLYGNAVADPVFDDTGAVTQLSPVPFWQCQPILVPADPSQSLGPTAPSARLAFDIMRLVTPWGGSAGVPKRIFADDALYLRDRSDTGILGRSRLSRCPAVLEASLGAQTFAASMWANQGTPNVALEHPGALSTEAAQRVAQSWQDTMAGPMNARKPVVLEEGLKANPLNLSAEDNELLDARRFSVEEIARIYDVPPPMIGDWSKATFSNTSTAFEWWGSKTLLPIVNKIEREFSRSIILDPAISLHLDLSGMLRGDFTQRTAASVALVRSGILSANEAREIEGFGPIEGADKLVMQATGGKPPGTADGMGDEMPALSASLNGSGKKPGNGALSP